jgi:hypothetical protein
VEFRDGPASKEEERVEGKGEQHEQGDDPQAPADLFEQIRWKRG